MYLEGAIIHTLTMHDGLIKVVIEEIRDDTTLVPMAIIKI